MMTATENLFVRPSFLRGMARVIDVAGVLHQFSYNTSTTPEESDARAIASDWQVVGQDIRDSIEMFQEEFADDLNQEP